MIPHPIQHAWEVLEFPALLELIAGYTAGAAGREFMLALRPQRRVAEAQAAHSVLRDLLALETLGLRVPQPGFPDVRPLLVRVAPEGMIVSGDELLPVRRLLEAARFVHEFAGRREFQDALARGCVTDAARGGQAARGYHEEIDPRGSSSSTVAVPVTQERDDGLRSRLPTSPEDTGETLTQLLTAVDPLPRLYVELARALDESGQILDGASPRLRELRTGIRALETRIQRQLDGILRRFEASGWVQEGFVTQRNQRYVIPLKREAKGRVSGVIHDHSDSGRTVFIEPPETLPLGNELADMRLEERDECRRVLAALSSSVRNHGEALLGTAAHLARLDARVATARWATEFDAVLPRFGAHLSLRHARHPLLQKRLGAPGTSRGVVPVDVPLPADTRVLLITGPNSGGKTAALKAVGLLTLAAQAGLPVTASAESELVFFDRVLADIGDEQSLQQNLSTFTGHLTRLSEILVAARGGRSLVLLDELGTGTDPLEGGALACSILATLADAGSITLATSHLGVLKNYVHERPHMLNAAVRFNPDTQSPEYVLELGQPGASQALTIAARIGFPPDVLNRAREFLSSDYLRLESMLAHIEEAQRQASQRERELEQAARGLAGEREQVRGELAKLRGERRRLLHEAYMQAEGIVVNARQDMERMVRELRTAAVTPAPASELKTVREQVQERGRKLRDAAVSTAPRPAQPLTPRQLTVGQNVWVEKLHSNARIVAMTDDRRRVTVQAGAARFEVEGREIGRQQADGDLVVVPLHESRPRAQGAVAQELVLIGKRVDDALPVLDQFLDLAALSQLPEVRIVHGFGTGRLQEAVHEFLRSHPLVGRFRLGRGGRDPGGGGVTLVEMKRK